MKSRITEIDPPRKLTFTWGDNGEVSFELETRGDDVLLSVTHRRIAGRDMLLKVSAGWHAHLDILAARMNDREPAPFWDEWAKLQKDYEARLPA